LKTGVVGQNGPVMRGEALGGPQFSSPAPKALNCEASFPIEECLVADNPWPTSIPTGAINTLNVER